MENTTIRLTRARSFTAESPAQVLGNNSVSLPYGTPMTYSSTLYTNLNNNTPYDSDTKTNHMFVMGDQGTALAQSRLLYHVGPYWGDTGLGVDNDPTSRVLGRIQLRLAAGYGITITDGTGAQEGYKVIAADDQHQVLVLHYDDTNHVMMDATDTNVVTPSQIMTAHNNNNIVVCVYGTDVYYLSLIGANGSDCMFVCTNGNTLKTITISSVSGNGTWAETSNGYIDIVQGDNWHLESISDGTSSYTLAVGYRRNCVVIDNSANSGDLSVNINTTGLPSGSKCYTAGSTTLSVPAGQAKLFKVRNIASNAIYIESETVSVSLAS